MGEPKPISARGTESSNPVPSSRQSVSRRISPSAPGEARVFRRFGGNPGRQRRQRRAKPSNIAPRRGNGRIQLIVATRSLLAYRATLETDPALPHSDTRRVHFDRPVSPETRDLASLFSTMLVAQPRADSTHRVQTWTSIAPCSVSSRTQPALRAGAARASWTRPARDTLPEAGRLRGMVHLVSPRNAIWILDPERRHPSHGDIPTRSVPDVA